MPTIPGMEEMMYKYGNDEQLKFCRSRINR